MVLFHFHAFFAYGTEKCTRNVSGALQRAANDACDDVSLSSYSFGSTYAVDCIVNCEVLFVCHLG